MQYITEAEIDKITSDTCGALAKEPRVRITIRPENGEAFWEGGINGHFFRIKTGIPVSVPQSLAKQISLSRQVLEESERRTRAYQKSGGRKVQ